MTTAAEALAHALDALADRDERTSCQGEHRDRWTSDDAEERAWAAGHCTPCPVIRECAEAAQEADERWGVWAGVDRTKTTRKKGNAA